MMRLDDAASNLHAIHDQDRRGPSDAEDPATAFEALFVGEIFKAMRATVHPADDSFGASVLTSMLDEQFAQHIAASGSLGLTSVLHDALDEKNLKL